jgi:stage II sporulation protein D
VIRALLVTAISVLLTFCAAAQATSTGADLITVEVFSTQTVHAITVTPLGTNASLQSCEKCPDQSVLAPFSANLANGGIQLSSGTHSMRIRLHGSFRIRIPNTESSASAAGTWIIEPHGAAIRLLLTMPSERYVAAALNGEAAKDEPLESLKAMAVAMRTFALENSRRHSGEGFSLCDSTHCQALRIGAARDEVERAVRETAGETLWFNQRRASVYYSQNCGGTTEDVSNVWPSVRATYLTSHPDPYCLRHSDAAWHAQFPLDQLSSLFKVQGWHTPAKIDSIRVIKRTRSGRALTLQVNGIGGPASISASSFHFAVNRSLGWNQIRSDWYELDTLDHVLRVKGKGHGHAVGLCQDGAFEMAREGKSYLEILAFYLPGTAVRVSAADDGWKSTRGTSWNLRTVGSATLWMELGNSEWEKARSVFPTQAIPQPTVYAMPSTELYRQTTGEPGWLLASTRGSDIFLQPASVLQGNGAMRKILLHEFLHVLVEQESSSKTPLWLREGLVEFLVDGSRQYESFPEVSLTTLDANLSHPPDKASSQRAHSAAASMVAGLVKHYGFATVRRWLREGVPNGIAP